MGPGEVAKFGLLQNFRKILAGFDVLEVDVEPVGAGLGQAVREDGSVLFDQKYKNRKQPNICTNNQFAHCNLLNEGSENLR